jgi:hypothetical protein
VKADVRRWLLKHALALRLMEQTCKVYQGLEYMGSAKLAKGCIFNSVGVLTNACQ